jgi:hypothetical protein
MDSSSDAAKEWVSRSESLVRHVKTRCLRFWAILLVSLVGFRSYGSGSGASWISGDIAGDGCGGCYRLVGF